ncbi:IQ calmodulin-binding motif-containing protein [Archangium violaceum]|uniref:IQ calmodulin-binding motif-containing protein n=1 Tax=Archangium violaceum TaxID=83451 RepID=UPI001950AEAF|nr:IQ calmodulin-binding motif-containing protein [Archangium violaceum]QRN97714.1 IQ calmodulin-binding motif-containing protein [Archangium violaceum]
MKILEYGTGLSANDVVKETKGSPAQHNANWLIETLKQFDGVAESVVTKKNVPSRQFKILTAYFEFIELCRSDDAVLHLFPKPGKQEEKKQGKASTSAPSAPSLRDQAYTTVQQMKSKEKIPGLWMIDELIRASESVSCVSGFSRDLLTKATTYFKTRLSTTDLGTTFLPLVGPSWYVYIDHRLLKPKTQLAKETKYYDPNHMDMPGKLKPEKSHTFLGLRYLEILAGAGSPDASLLQQLLASPCDIINPGLDWPTRLWFMVACLAESGRHVEWHLLGRIGIELVRQRVIPWGTLVKDELWAPQTDGAVDAMKFYKNKGEPRYDDWRYFDRCVELLITWMMSLHQTQAPTTEFDTWLQANLRTQLELLVSGINKNDWSRVPDLSTYRPRIAAPPPVVPVKPKTQLEVFQDRIDLAKKRQEAAPVIQSAVRGYLARLHFRRQKQAAAQQQPTIQEPVAQ